MSYTVKNIKTFNGMEGSGFNCNLYRDKTKIAEVIDDASGGMIIFYWADQEAPRVETNGVDYKDEPKIYKDTPEESLFRTHCLGLPKWDCNGTMVHTDMDLYIEELVNQKLMSQNLKLKLKKIMLYEDGKFSSYKIEPTTDHIKAVRKRHPDAIILNQLAFTEALELWGQS
jgi:hypothetical protein